MTEKAGIMQISWNLTSSCCTKHWVSKGSGAPFGRVLRDGVPESPLASGEILLGAVAPPEKRSEKVNFVAASHKRGNPCKGGIS